MDILPHKHETVQRNGTRLHVARLESLKRPEAGGCGSSESRTLLFLHGWPEFWWTWAPLMERLSARRYDCIAPDLRGFGDSDKHPDGRSAEVGPEVHAADALAVLDALQLGRVGVVSHDVGAYAAQSLARLVPERLAGLFFFNCPHPGIGPRGAAPEMLKEIWYQSFNQMPLAAELVGASRDTIRSYIGTMLRHWAAGNPGAFDHSPNPAICREASTGTSAKPKRGSGCSGAKHRHCRLSQSRPACVGASATRSCASIGPTSSGIPSPISISRPFRASAISRTARTRTAPPTRSTGSSSCACRREDQPQASLSQRRMAATARSMASGPG